MATELVSTPVEAPVETPVETDRMDQPYLVFLWNDPVTPMQVVTRVLMKVFGYAKDKAELLMITAHLEGKAVVWSGDKARARRYCVQLGLYGLQATIGRSS